MKSLVLAAGLTALLGSAAFAQTTTTPAAPATTPPPATTATPGTMGAAPAAGGAGMGAGSPIVVMPQPQAGAAAMHYLASDVEDEDVYGANNEKIGEVEDFVLNADGSIAAVVVEVGGFLGVGEKDVLVNWQALEVTMDGDDMRITSLQLTREALDAAQGVDLDTMKIGDD